MNEILNRVDRHSITRSSIYNYAKIKNVNSFYPDDQLRDLPDQNLV